MDVTPTRLPRPPSGSRPLCAVLAFLILMAFGAALAASAQADPPPPQVESISPDHGPRSGGNTVVITGANFTGATAVQFGPLEAESFTINSDSEITAVAPPYAGPGEEHGVVDVFVFGPGGVNDRTPADHYGYAPVIDEITPSYGPATGGTAVTLSGYGLEETTAVDFGSVPAESFTVNLDGSVTAIAPPEAPEETIVPIRATTPEGVTEDFLQQETFPTNYFTYGPTVTSVTPDEGPEGGGTKAIIHGTGFASPEFRCFCAFPFLYAVSFGSSTLQCGIPLGTAAPPCTPVEFEVISETELIAVTPPGTGTVSVAVSTFGGTSPANPAAQFSYALGAPPPTPPEGEPQVLQLLHCSVQAGAVGVCSGRSVNASAVAPIKGPTARLYRGKTLYAKGTARVHRSRSRLLLDPVRRIAPGRYMLVLAHPSSAGNGSSWPRREPVIIK